MMAYVGAEHAIRSLLTANAAVSAIVSTRVYANGAPQTPTLPYLVIDLIGNERFGHMTATAGLGQATIELIGIGRNKNDLLDLREKCRLALNGRPRGNVTVGADTIRIDSIRMQDEDDITTDPVDGSDARIYGFTQDYRVTYAESVPAF